MKSKNGSIKNKPLKLSFIKKRHLIVPYAIVILFLAAVSCLLIIDGGDDFPLSLVICWGILGICSLIGMSFSIFNGLRIYPNGDVIFVPGVGVKKIKADQLARIVITFYPWIGQRYSTVVNIFYKDGKTFSRDYGNEMRSMSSKYSSTRALPNQMMVKIYSLSWEEIAMISDQLRSVSFCTVLVENPMNQ